MIRLIRWQVMFISSQDKHAPEYFDWLGEKLDLTHRFGMETIVAENLRGRMIKLSFPE